MRSSTLVRVKVFKRYLLPVLVAGLAVSALRLGAPYVFVPNSVPRGIPLASSTLPDEPARTNAVSAAAVDAALRGFADRETAGLARDERHGGVRLSQIILARLLRGQNIDECNQLIRELTVWGRAGSSWAGHRTGDYDFALIWLTAMLYEFGDDAAVLYPETRDYLLNVLLTEEGRLNRFVPRTGKMVFETENHLLMREGSRYLKNQWLKSRGEVPAALDNEQNGLQDWLTGYLNHMRLKGVYEYNSTPYVVYTILPLLNLAEYAESETIRTLAASVIDNVMLRYACGSLNLKQCAPFRRQFKYAESDSLRLNRLAPFVLFQTGRPVEKSDLLVFASIFHNYVLPEETFRRFAGPVDDEHLAVFAHEQKGGAEIYSGGPGWLLSAGGAFQGIRSKVIARPIALLLDDDAETLADCIHIRGSNDWKQWNSSGVHRRFAVAEGTLHIPQKLGFDVRPGWNALHVDADLTVAFFQGLETALLLVMPDCPLPPEDIAALLKSENPDPETAARFQWPEPLAPDGLSEVGFNIHAQPDQWVITSINGQPVETDFEPWPFMQMN